MNAETILTILAVTTAVASALHAAIPAMRAWAASTASTRDDAAVSKLEVTLDWLIRAADVARRFVPRVVVGPLPSRQPIARSLPPRSDDTLPMGLQMPGVQVTGLQPLRPLSVPPPAPIGHRQSERDRLRVSAKLDTDDTPLEHPRGGESER